MDGTHQGMSPEEIEFLNSEGDGNPAEHESEVANAVALRRDDEDEDEVAQQPQAAPEEKAEEEQAAEADAEPSKPADTAPVPADPAAAVTPSEPPAPSVALPKYQAATVAELDKARAELVAREEEAFAKYNDGDIEVGEYQATRRDVAAQLDSLLVQRTLAEANAQHERQIQQAAEQAERKALADLMTSAKAAGTVDYFTDTKAQGLFDWALNSAQADPDNAGKQLPELIAIAHKTVLQRRGIATQEAAPEKKVSRSVDMAAIPPTLSRVPPAADASISGNEFSHLAGLKPADLELAVARMTPEQQERWLSA